MAPATATATPARDHQATLWGADPAEDPALPADPGAYTPSEWDALCDQAERRESRYPGRTIESEAVPSAFDVAGRQAAVRHLKELALARLRAADEPGAGDPVPRRGRPWDVALTGIRDVGRMGPRGASRAIRREYRVVMGRARAARQRRDERLRAKVAAMLRAAGLDVPGEA
jgi:hypothetical protein